MAARPSFRLPSIDFARHLARDAIAISIGVGHLLCHARRAVVSDIAANYDLTDTLAMAVTPAAMQAVVDNYPTSEYADDARSKIRMAKDQLAGKEMQVGRYYQERKEYIAAVSRYRNVVESYQSTNQVQEALARLVECYYAMGVTTEAQTAAAVLGANYPDSQWYADSYKLQKSGGLEPRENSGSWIARAAKKLVLGEG